MKTIKHYTWEIKPTNTPLIKRRCSKCNCNSLFYCSNNFRLNSQKKYIDVWLIYRCTNCDTTYNLTILSRTKPESIDKNIYHRFMHNDEELAWKYAFDSDIMSRNNVTLDFDNVEYAVYKGDFNIENIINTDEDIIDFEIKTEYNLNLRINQLIRNRLCISNKEIEKLVDNNSIILFPIGIFLKNRIKNGIVIRIEKNALMKDI